MKRRDAIIDELHRVREDFGKAHDFDVRRIAVTIRLHEAENPEGIIRESDGRRVGKRTPNPSGPSPRTGRGISAPLDGSA
jgi:hypothetical protein